MQTFFTNTIESKFIKLLLYKKPILLPKTCKSGDTVYKGIVYFYNGQIIKITQTGIIDNGSKYQVLNIRDLDILDRKNMSFYMSEYNFYDTETHEMLGKYLRQFRDITNIDLMPFYNCFSCNISHTLSINDSNEFVESALENYQTLLVPINFDKTYTIAIDCNNIKIKPIFYSKYGILDCNEIIQNTQIVQQDICSFKQPILFNIKLNQFNENDIIKCLNYERYLKLAIQIPESTQSSIVVLEGNYIKPQENLSQLSLLQLNNKTIYAFSDKLIEFLLQNVVTSLDEFNEDIKYIQDRLGINTNNSLYGIWTDDLRDEMFKRYMNIENNLYSKIDITGYMDKDIERAFMEDKMIRIKENGE